MKKTKMLAVCLTLLFAILLFCGCAPTTENLLLQETTQTMLDALIADDVDAAYALVRDVCTEEEFTPVFSNMRALLGNTETYTLNLLSFYSSQSLINGQSSATASASYEMVTGQGKFIVSIQASGDCSTLQSFYLTPYEMTDYYFTGTLNTMKNATVFQWVLLLSNLFVYGASLFALVDCCRHKMKKKALWIVLLILGFITLGATVSSTGFRINWNLLSVTAYSALIRYGSGTIVIRFLVPAGAIAYFFSRRSLLAASEPAPQSPPDAEPANEISETE